MSARDEYDHINDDHINDNRIMDDSFQEITICIYLFR